MCRLHMVWYGLLLCVAFGGGGYKNINTVFVSARFMRVRCTNTNTLQYIIYGIHIHMRFCGRQSLKPNCTLY